MNNVLTHSPLMAVAPEARRNDAVQAEGPSESSNRSTTGAGLCSSNVRIVQSACVARDGP